MEYFENLWEHPEFAAWWEWVLICIIVTPLDVILVLFMARWLKRLSQLYTKPTETEKNDEE